MTQTHEHILSAQFLELLVSHPFVGYVAYAYYSFKALRIRHVVHKRPEANVLFKFVYTQATIRWRPGQTYWILDSQTILEIFELIASLIKPQKGTI